MSQTGAKTYYGYLFNAEKKPTKILDALLRSLGNYIEENIGDKDVKCLTPAKIAEFYKTVGGDYDSLFVATPNTSISWIYTSIGCQHTLQPTGNDFEAPSIPALTSRGFVRWESIELLLGPEEHCPFIQTALQKFGLKHPDTGEPFPLDLPTDSFPLEPDKDIEEWHTACAEKLRRRASPDDFEAKSPPQQPTRPRPTSHYSHARQPTPGSRPVSPLRSPSYFGAKSSTRKPGRPHIPYAHVSATPTSRPARPTLNRSPSHRARQFLAPEEPYSPRTHRGRRRSEPDEPAPSPRPEEHTRRHSHPRHPLQPSDADVSDSDASPPNEQSKKPRSRHAYVEDESPRLYGEVPKHAYEEKDEPKIRFRFPGGDIQSDPTSPMEPRSQPRSDEDLRRRPSGEEFRRGAYSSDHRNVSSSTRKRTTRSDSRSSVTWKDLSGIVKDKWARSQHSSEESDKKRGHSENERARGSRPHSRDEGRRRDYEGRERRERRNDERGGVVGVDGRKYPGPPPTRYD